MKKEEDVSRREHGDHGVNEFVFLRLRRIEKKSFSVFSVSSARTNPENEHK